MAKPITPFNYRVDIPAGEFDFQPARYVLKEYHDAIIDPSIQFTQRYVMTIDEDVNQIAQTQLNIAADGTETGEDDGLRLSVLSGKTYKVVYEYHTTAPAPWRKNMNSS